MEHRRRQQRLQRGLPRLRLDALLVTHLPNVRYLCGFTGSAGVLALTADRAALFTDGRYTAQAHREAVGVRVIIGKGAAAMAALKWLHTWRARAVGFEAERVSVAARNALAATASRGIRLRPTAGLVERTRMIKEPGEVRLIRGAVKLGSRLFPGALKAIRPGVPETAVAASLEYAARRAGAEGMSFSTIVAAGARSALPHGVASSQVIPSNGFVLLDFGVILAGYCSDMSRTVYLGMPPAKARKMYQAVREAQQAAVETVRPQVAAGDVDAAARRVLQSAGYGRYFTHSTGHGVGLEIHEPPRLGKGQKELLEPGMVITIEPGVYVPGYGGVRIEDMVLVTQHGCEVLTPTPKDLIALPA
jgi:Xaa-Pro aminopeptidase